MPAARPAAVPHPGTVIRFVFVPMIMATAPSIPQGDSADPAAVVNVEPEAATLPDVTPPEQHALTATVLDGGAPVANKRIIFTFDPGSANPQIPSPTCSTDPDGTCQLIYSGNNGGTDSIRAVLDDNNNTLPDEVDPDEARDETGSPGSQPEPDRTDVVEASWEAPEPTILDVSPEQETVIPSFGATLDAEVRDQFGDLIDANVDFEITSGPNANRDAQKADLECDATGGRCSVGYSGMMPGPDVVTGWLDRNGDDAVPGETDAGEAQDEQATPGDVPEPDGTDVVTRTWAGNLLDLAPETARKTVAESFQFSALIIGPGGSRPSGVSVVFTVVSGPNAGRTGSCTTGGSGSCSFSYPGAGEGTDLIFGAIDEDGDGQPNEGDESEGRDESVQPGSSEEPDATDLIEVAWTPTVCPGFEGIPANFIVGTDGDDTLEGTGNADVLCGLGGNDTIVGGRGNDVLVGGPGDDFLDGEQGAFDFMDLFDAPGPVVVNLGRRTAEGDGSDTLMRVEAILGGFFDDVLIGDGRLNVIFGVSGRDRIRGEGRPDFLDGGSGADRLFGGDGDDLIRGAPGPDRLFGQRGRDRLNGGTGRDVCDGGQDQDRFNRSCETKLS